MKIGQVVLKVAGRESNREAVIVDVIDDTFVLIDGNVKRRKCNIKHLEPVDIIVKISKNASTSQVQEALKSVNIAIREKKPAKESKKEKPIKKRKVKAIKEPKKESKKVEKKPAKESKKKETKTKTKKPAKK